MLGTCTFDLARSASLREAADVLRTDRRTKRKNETTMVNAGWLLLQPTKPSGNQAQGAAKTARIIVYHSKVFQKASKTFTKSFSNPSTIYAKIF